MADIESQHKKKRRQNVACDSCKLRRIKCDLADLLSSHDPSSSTSNTTPSLSDLVRANPSVECTNCRNKELKCTTNQILNPTKPNKGGKRIEEARKIYGEGEGGIDGQSEQEAEQSQAAGRVEDIAVDDAGDWELPDITASLGDGPQLTGTFPSDLSSSTLQPQLPGEHSTNQSRVQWDELLATPTHSIAQYLQDRGWDANVQGPVQLSMWSDQVRNGSQAPSPGERNDSNYPNTQIASLWDHLTANRSNPEILAVPDQPGRFWSSDPSQISLDGHSSEVSRAPNMDRNFKFGPGMTSFIERNDNKSQLSYFPPHHTTRSAHFARTSVPLAQTSTTVSPLDGVTPTINYVQGRKRLRGDDSSVSPLTNEDTWKFWADPQQAICRWGRREVVQERMADRVLGYELSKHLVKTFFHCVHPSFPAMSPEGFFKEWQRAGQISDRMAPAQEALCAVMEAWGARYSDSPVVLGLSPSRSALAPKVIKPDGTLTPGTQARAHWGRARLNVCNALVERARCLIDESGIFRQPSVTGVQCLLLYNQLLHSTDQESRAIGQWMENQVIHASTIEQMKLLQLMWDSPGSIPNRSEAESRLTDVQMRMNQRRIFWTIIVSDAFNAAASGELPKIPDEELQAAAHWLTSVEAKLPMSTFKTLAFFMSCYFRLSLVGRLVARKLSAPNKRPGNVVVAEFSAAVKDVWTQIKSVAKDMVVNTVDLLKASENTLLGFSPLSYVSNLRLSCPFILLVTHQVIREQLDFRKNLRGSFISDPSTASSTSSQSPPGPVDTDLAMLEELHMQSVDILLQSCRSQIAMFESLLPTGMVQSAAIFLRVLLATAQFLAEVPTNEQGYPTNTLGGCGWTWEAKQREVNVCVSALYQLGWAWADVAEVLDGVMLSMERMQPIAEELETYAQNPIEIDERILATKARDEMEEARVIEHAMLFWPPQSVPMLIERAMENLNIDEGDDLDLSSGTVPWKLLQAIQDVKPNEKTYFVSTRGAHPAPKNDDRPITWESAMNTLSPACMVEDPNVSDGISQPRVAQEDVNVERTADPFRLGVKPEDGTSAYLTPSATPYLPGKAAGIQLGRGHTVVGGFRTHGQPSAGHGGHGGHVGYTMEPPAKRLHTIGTMNDSLPSMSSAQFGVHMGLTPPTNPNIQMGDGNSDISWLDFVDFGGGAGVEDAGVVPIPDQGQSQNVGGTEGGDDANLERILQELDDSLAKSLSSRRSQ